MTARLRSEDGWVLATSITLLAIMLTLSLALYSVVDTGQERSREQRERESSLNLNEGVLYSQGFTLAQDWPGNAAASVPTVCTHATVQAGCPTPSHLAAAQGGTNFANTDQSGNVVWETRVRDNGGPLAEDYVPAQADADQPRTETVNGGETTVVCPGPCRWDANGDRQVWVQSYTVVRGKPRNVVALLRLEQLREATPETAVVAGGVSVTNNGNKTMISGTGSQVIVRCDPARTDCADWDATPVPQITPPPVQGNPGNLMNASQLQRFKERAIADGRYFSGCPTGNDLRGAVVFIEFCSGDVKVTNSTVTEPCNPTPPPVATTGGGNQLSPNCINQLDSPGLLIVHCGGIDFSGGLTYVGVIYAANNSDGTCAGMGTSQRGGNCNTGPTSNNHVIDISGGFGVWGALAIDGPGCLRAGSNAIQIQYDANVFSSITSYGTVGLVQNTWRELPAS